MAAYADRAGHAIWLANLGILSGWIAVIVCWLDGYAGHA
jgi:hypothetical protein